MANRFKVLLAQPLHGSEEENKRTLEELRRGLPPPIFEVVIPSSEKEDELLKLATDADVILGIPVSRKVIESAKKLKMIQTFGTGIDKIDMSAAAERGVPVCNAAGLTAVPVAEHAIALMLAVAKLIPQRHTKLKEGTWDRRLSKEVYGKTLGIVGLGSIGAEIAKRMKPFGMRIIAIKRHPTKDLVEELGIDYLGGIKDLDYILEKSDFVVVSVPDTPETKHMIGIKELSEMKSSAYIINTSRGVVINEEALIEALKRKQIAGAGLDVFEKEPIDPENPLLKLDNVVLTPHSAGRTLELSWEMRMKFITENIKNVLEGKKPANLVSPEFKYVTPEFRFKLS